MVFTLAEAEGLQGPGGRGTATLGEGGQARVCHGSLQGARAEAPLPCLLPPRPALHVQIVMTGGEFKQFFFFLSGMF